LLLLYYNYHRHHLLLHHHTTTTAIIFITFSTIIVDEIILLIIIHFYLKNKALKILNFISTSCYCSKYSIRIKMSFQFFSLVSFQFLHSGSFIPHNQMTPEFVYLSHLFWTLIMIAYHHHLWHSLLKKDYST
jgi:hypothetical protein